MKFRVLYMYTPVVDMNKVQKLLSCNLTLSILHVVDFAFQSCCIIHKAVVWYRCIMFCRWRLSDVYMAYIYIHGVRTCCANLISIARPAWISLLFTSLFMAWRRPYVARPVVSIQRLFRLTSASGGSPPPSSPSPPSPPSPLLVVLAFDECVVCCGRSTCAEVQ